MGPDVSPIQIIIDLRRMKRGDITFSDFAERSNVIRTRGMSHTYMGYAEHIEKCLGGHVPSLVPEATSRKMA